MKESLGITDIAAREIEASGYLAAMQASVGDSVVIGGTRIALNDARAARAITTAVGLLPKKFVEFDLESWFDAFRQAWGRVK